MIGDLTDRDSLERSLAGVDRVFVNSAVGPAILAQTNLVDAAKRAAVDHIVKLSWIGASEHLVALPFGRWHAEVEIRRAYEATEREATIAAVRRELGPEEPGRIAVDLAEIDARPAEATATDSLLAIVSRDGTPGAPLSESLARLPAYSLVARRYRRAG